MESIGIVLTCYNRSEYLKKTLNSLKNSYIPEYTFFYIIDDASTDKETIKLIENFEYEGVEIIKVFKETNSGVWDCLKQGFEYLNDLGVEIMCNLDSDVDLKKDWLFRILEIYISNKNTISSGFNASNSAKYKRKEDVEHETYWEKYWVCGLNLLFNKSMYKYVLQSLDYKEFWDLELVQIMRKVNKKYVCTKPSVVQHIGMQSSMGHQVSARALDF